MLTTESLGHPLVCCNHKKEKYFPTSGAVKWCWGGGVRGVSLLREVAVVTAKSEVARGECIQEGEVTVGAGLAVGYSV